MACCALDWRVATGGSVPGLQLEALFREPCGQRLVQRGDAVVVEARRHRPEHRHRVRGLLEPLAVALVLLAHVAQRVLRALAVELVDRDEVREVQHVDLLELARRAEFRRHHVQRCVDQRHDRGVALPDPRGFDDDEVEARDLARRDDVGQRLRDLAAGVARGERAHVDLRMLDRVHPDPVAEQRAAGLAPRRVDGDDRDLQRVALVDAEAPHQFVGQRALARAARAGDAERRHRGLRRAGQQFGPQLRGHDAGLEARDQPRQRARLREPVAGVQRRERTRQVVREVGVGRRDDLVDHPLQAELLPVLGREDPRHAVLVQFRDFGGDDHAAAAAEHLDVAGAALAQQVQHVLEELDVAALVGRDRDAVGVLLDRAVDDLLDRPVVAQVDDLAAGCLQDAPHDVDRRVVAVEEAGGRDEADLVDRLEYQRMPCALIVHREPRVLAGDARAVGRQSDGDRKLTGTAPPGPGRRRGPLRRGVHVRSWNVI